MSGIFLLVCNLGAWCLTTGPQFEHQAHTMIGLICGVYWVIKNGLRFIGVQVTFKVCDFLNTGHDCSMLSLSMDILM